MIKWFYNASEAEAQLISVWWRVLVAAVSQIHFSEQPFALARYQMLISSHHFLFFFFSCGVPMNHTHTPVPSLPKLIRAFLSATSSTPSPWVFALERSRVAFIASNPQVSESYSLLCWMFFFWFWLLSLTSTDLMYFNWGGGGGNNKKTGISQFHQSPRQL